MNAAAEHVSTETTEGVQPTNAGILHTAHSDECSNDEVNSVSASGLNAELAGKWLTWQCKMIADVITGAVYDTNGNTLTLQPVNGAGADRLAAASLQVIENDKPVITTEITYGNTNGRLGDIIATPIKEGKKTIGYVALLMTPRPQSRQNVVLQLLQWGGYWLESLCQLSDGIQIESGAFTQSLMASVLKHDNSHKACMEVAARISDRLNCDRVTLGLRNGMIVRVECIAHLASFDERTQLIRRIEASMEESIDQKRVVTLPVLAHHTNEPESVITTSHRELQETESKNSSIATFPLQGAEIFGAITLERTASTPFDKDTVAWCESVLSAIAPVIELKRFEERSIFSKLRDSLRKSCQSLVGPKYLKLKIAAVLAAATMIVASIMPGNHIVTAPAVIEGAQAQIVAAPIAGFIKSSEVRAGDKITTGQVIATLDDRTLQLELQKWQGEKNKVEKAYQEALATKARTELSILRARSEQIEAEYALASERLEKTTLKAPFDGYITSGDLSQSLGAPVEIGDVLFEIAPSEEYKVIIKVDERDMAGLNNDKSGNVVIAAMPGDAIPFGVDQIVPLAISGEGNSYFRVEASIDDTAKELRPGMEGVARIEIGQRKLLWIWTHKLTDRVRLWLWSIGW